MKKTTQCSIAMFLALLCLLLSMGCAQPDVFGELSLCLSVNGVPLSTGSKSVIPGNEETTITYLIVGGYSDSGDTIEDQTFAINGSLKIKGLSVGTWHISVTGLNTDQLQITKKSMDDDVKIQSGKTTVASFNLQYLTEGTGSYSVTVTWPSKGGWFSLVTLDLGTDKEVSVTPGEDDVQAVFSKEDIAVGSYDVGLLFTNGSGTTVALPMMDTAKIYNGLTSIGTIELTEYDLEPVSDPVISIASQKTVTLSCATEGALVYYTIDGTDPVTSSTKQLYSVSFNVSNSSATILTVGSCQGYRDSNVIGKKMDGTDPEGGIVIEVPGTIDDLTVTQGTGYAFTATYTEDGSGTKTIRWYVDGTEQDDTDNDDDFTYKGTLSDGRHQVMVKITKGDVTYAASLRFSVKEGGIVIEVPGTIEDLTVIKGTGYAFTATYTEDGSGTKTIRWYVDGTEQDDTDNDDDFTYKGTLSDGRHQVMVKITKGDITYAASLRFSVNEGGIVIEVPGTIEDLSITQESVSVFTATYTETGDGDKTVRWYMDSELQDDIDDNDSFTYGGTLSDSRHQVTVKITKGEKTYASSLRFSTDEGDGGVVITVPGIISNLMVTQESDYTFTTTYIETGEGGKTVLWYMDGTKQDDTDNNDSFTYSGTLSSGRHQVMVEIIKGTKTYASPLRFTVYGLGASGPAGGIIVEVNPNAATDGWTYMEAAPVDESSASTWSEAVRLCSAAIYNGYEDWMLPTKEDLEVLYEQRSALEGFASSWYWSSDEDDTGNKGWQLNFGIGVSKYYTKSGCNHVRAIRIF